jgi:hypothetical protein
MDITNEELAARIYAHLVAAEADADWNSYESSSGMNLSHLFGARAWSTKRGKYVYVTYVAYQGNNRLSRGDALAYLEWLDAGNRGRHFECQRSAVTKK